MTDKNIITICRYSHHKYLIGASRGSIITDISKYMVGLLRIKKFSESDLVEMKPYADAFMVHKGFSIDDICDESSISIIRLVFLKKI
ncbi:hypothetical protein X975_27173, partial [Stegodyphus mimosarum]